MKFSIVLPVHNGGQYLKTCIESLLSQTYHDFDILVLENKSNDGSLEWLESLKDHRINIFPSAAFLSIEENWLRVNTLPKNEFMTLIGHDDILEPWYLETMVNLINKYPDASLYQTRFSYIDENDNKIRDCKPMAEVESAVEFLGKFLKQEIDVMGTGFMIRSEDYEKLGGIPGYPNLLFADFELWIRAASKSYKATSPENCFSFRLHQSMTKSSTDTKYHQAFERFMHFLASLKNESPAFDITITENAASYLMFYCRALSHRLIRTKKEFRKDLSVKKFVKQCAGYAVMLGIEKKFQPGSSVRLAETIDQFVLTRTFFLWFKRIFPKPVMS